MEQQALTLIFLAVGALAGATASWLVMRGRVAAAFQNGAAAPQAELGALRERLRMFEDERAQLRSQHEAERAQATRWRDDLDNVRDERAQLAERAARLPELEGQLAAARTALQERENQLANLREASGRLESALKADHAQLLEARQALEAEKAQLHAAQAEVLRLSNALKELQARSEAERASAEEKLALLNQAKVELGTQFKNLANEILEEKSKRFTEQNQANLGGLLNPLSEKIKEFQTKVEDSYVKESKDRVALGEQVRQLMELNRKLSDDANNLTSALKGSSQTQGAWGELILERVLEGSGLRRGEEYELQESHTLEDGSRLRPDVVIRLPEGRNLVVDAKVSLIAYNEYANGEEQGVRDTALKRHLDSVRTHIKGLSAKNYQDLYQLGSLDFVLMFVPVEPAFMLAVSHDRELFMDAWGKNVLLVSPSTLLFVVRTVAHLWRQEQQSRNAQDIAKRGAELYDKLVGFVADLQKVGERIGQARDSYDAAYGKLTAQRGNVIRQAEMLRELGIKPTKALPVSLVDAAREEGHLPPPEGLRVVE